MLVGLGNPGPKYANTRHNVGFMVIDEVARRLGVTAWKTKSRAKQALVQDRDVLLVEPQSYMNESGVPVRLIATWYRVPNERVLVVYDELDLPFGRLRVRASGSSAGHNGMKSVIAFFGPDIARLRVGIGRGSTPLRSADHDVLEVDAIDRVLGSFTSEEQADLPDVIGAAADAAMLWLEQGVTAAANMANAWRLGPPESLDKESNQTQTDPR